MSASSVNHRAFAYEGVTYTVINPSPVQHLPGYAIVDPHLSLVGRDLRKPRYATNKCPELAYMLRHFTVENAFLARLQCDHNTMPIVKAQSGYMLSPPIAKSWWHLESSLVRASDILLVAASGKLEGKFPFDAFWPNPSEYRYRDVHPSEQAARIAALKARDACAILAARCTMAIALLTSRPDTVPPQWVVALMREGVPPAWIDVLRASVIADLSPNLRVGAVIYPTVLEGHEAATAWVHHVPCMLRANLPVYIAWPKEGLTLALDRYPFLRPYLPDFASVPEVPLGSDGQMVMYPRPQVVGMPTSFRWSDICPPVLHQDSTAQSNPSVAIPHGQGQHPGETCREFLARRQATSRQREEQETEEHRNERLQRQQKADTFQRPTRPTKVYVWKEVGDVDDQVTAEMLDKPFRAYVKPAAVAGLWQSHPNSHKHYDAWADEWDICSQLTPDDPVADDPWDDIDDQPLPSEPSASRAEAQAASRAEAQAIAFNAELQWFYHDEASESLLPAFDAIDDILRNHYGLVPDYRPNAGINYDAFPAEKLRKYTGYLATHLPDNHVLCKPLAGLVSSLLSSPTAPSAPGLIWDLNPSCDSYLLGSERKHGSMEVVSVQLNRNPWYRIRYTGPGDEGCWWELVVCSAATVVELYRQPLIADRLRAAAYLATKGMPFQTIFLPDRRQAVTPLCPSHPMTIWRPRGASFGPHDYLAYEGRARELLSQPRGRAAFLRGGIVWRLAMQMLHGELPGVVTRGPSQDIYCWGQAFRPDRGDDYYDDALTTDELEAVCGVTKVFTNDSFKQTEDLSWWPKPNVWEHCSLNVGYWTPWCEEWFQAVRKRYLSGDVQLKNSSGWKNALTQFKPAKKLRDAVELASQQFLEDRMHIPSVRL